MTDHECATAIARWSRDCRVLLGVSQDAVAKACGLSQAAVSRLEHGGAATQGLRVYARVARYYAARAARLGMTLAPLRLDDPTTAPAVTGLDATHVKLLRAVTACTPSQRLAVWRVLEPLVAHLQGRDPEAVPPAVEGRP